MKKIQFIAATAVVLGLAMSGCATEKPAVKADNPDTTAVEAAPDDSDVIVDEAVVEDEDGAEVEAGQPEVASLDDTMVVGDWEVKVTEFAKNANEVLGNPNYYNERPKGQFVLVTYEATYTGAARTADAYMDLTWTLTTSDQQIHEEGYQTTPADDQSWPTTARKGGKVKMQVMFDVKPELLKGGILSVEGYDADFDTVYADFAI